MYQILCDGIVIYDPRDEEMILTGKKCKIGSNICGEASFTILANHPHYNKLKKLRSVFEIRQDNDTIFRGRMTEDSRDFDNMKDVDLEGAMAYLNDSIIRPFAFPGDFKDAASAENVVEYFFRWIIEQHNSQVEDFQKFKVGKVTVKDSNNYLSRSSTDYAKAWATMKDKLFGSDLGGYLCIRYEADGNYLDYLADYADDNGNKIVNSQAVEFGRNLLDFKNESDGKETYSAVIPLGKKDGDSQLTISSLPDGNVTDDIVKKGDTLYSKKAVAEYGWIYAPTSDTTFSDVTIAANLRERGVSFLKSKSSGFLETITMTATDLHLTDEEIEAFRVYKYVAASSVPHDSSGIYPLSELDIDMDNLQNTKIKVGETKGALTDKTSSTAQKITETAQKVTEIEQTYGEEIEKISSTISTDIRQLEDSISLVVTKTATGSVIDSASIIAAINENTSYVTIEAGQVNLTAYAKTADVEGIAEDAAEAAAADAISGITLTATNGETSSTVYIKHNGITIDSVDVGFTGVVTFSDLSTEGSTTIHGGNITANTISVKNLKTDSISGTDSVIEFDRTIRVPKIFDVSHIYFGGLSLIKNDTEYGDLVISTPGRCVFDNGTLHVKSGSYYYPVITSANVNSYIDTTAKFG